MPVTPYHFGPGLLLKGLRPPSMSLSAFILANLIIDAEVVVRLLTGRTPLHATLHTLWASLLVGLLSGAIIYGIGRLVRPTRETWLGRPALLGGLLGGLSQPLLDSVMHADVRPFWPMSGMNPMLQTVDVQTLHVACAVTGLVGGGILLLRRWRSKETAS